MDLLYESAWPALIVGGSLLFLILAFWFILRKSALLVALAVPLAIIGGGIYLERSVETDREAIDRTFDNIASALTAGKREEVEKYLTPDAKETLSRVRWALDRINLRKVGVYDLRLEVNNFTTPPIANAEFHGVVKYTFKGGNEFNAEIYSAHFTVELEKQEGNSRIPWLVTDHVEYTGGI